MQYTDDNKPDLLWLFGKTLSLLIGFGADIIITLAAAKYLGLIQWPV